MSTPLHTACRAAFLAALVAAPAANSQMYRWIDSHGAVTYSNKLPGDTSGVRDLTVVLETPGTMSAPEKSAADKRAPETASSSLPPLTEPPQASPRIAVSPNAPEAVRDPCLRSSDPKCIERNKAAYLPGRGYSPAAVGATSSTAAGGTLAGGSPPATAPTPPKASAYALPPGNELPPPPSGKR